jgi:hypothetical protein
MASLRLVSTFPALLILAGGALLAWELFRPRRGAALLAAFLLASSSWLLSTARWGWVANLGTALVVLSVFLALRADRAVTARHRTAALLQAAAAGLLLGVAQYCYPSAWLVAPVPFLLLAMAALHPARPAGRRQWVEAAGAGAVGLVLAVAPLAFHYASHPERAAARPRELSVTAGGIAPAARKIAANAGAYARLFITGGDTNERHGNPERPVLPVAVSGLAAVGLAAAVRAPRLRLAALAALLLLSGGLLAGGDGSNSFRVSAAAPFLVVLAVAGGFSLAGRLPVGHRRRGEQLLAALLVVSGSLDAAAFADWLSSPRLRGAFGGPERELADAIRGEVAAGRATGVLLDPRAARNPWVVDVLLAPPSGGGRRALVWAPVDPASMENVAAAALSGRTVLVAMPVSKAALQAVAARGGEAVAASTPLEGFPGWVLYRVGRSVSGERPRPGLPGPPATPR